VEFFLGRNVMKRSRTILATAAVCFVVGISLSAPRAHASPRGKTYEANLLFPQQGGPFCLVFHSDGQFSLIQPDLLQIDGAWVEVGEIWFSFATIGNDLNRILVFWAGNTFGDDAGALVATGLFVLLGYPLPPQVVLAAGHASDTCTVRPTGTSEDSAGGPGKSQ
jgi:hypothetical protein